MGKLYCWGRPACANFSRLSLSLVGALFFGVSAFAQFGYSLTGAQNIAGSYVDLGTSGTAISTRFAGGAITYDEDNSSVQNIGFNFYFNGSVFTQFVLNTNGFIKLGNTSPGTNQFNILDSGAIVNAIAIFNSNLRGGTSPEYRLSTTGTTGSRVCIIQFKNLRDAATSQYANINFQIKLYETSNKIEFVYGSFTSSGSAAAQKQTIVGIKGNDIAHSVNATKTEITAWSSATFIGGSYPPFTRFDHQNTVLPTAGITFRFNAVNDARVDAVYTLYKLPIFASNPHTIRARITNTGGTVLNSLPVTVNITGANSFSNTQNVTINPFSSIIVNFAAFVPTSTGTNLVTVSIPTDDTVANNSSTTNQLVNYLVYSYADDQPYTGGLGWGTDAGLLLTKYTITGTDSVVKVNIGLASTNTGNSIYAVVLNAAGTIVGQSDPYITQASDPGTIHEFVITNPPVFSNTDFYVGLAQTANASVAYYPLATQTEDPARPGAFYYLFGLGGGVPAEATTLGRFMISAELRGVKEAKLDYMNTLGRIPKTLGTYGHRIDIQVTNNGTRDLVNYPVTLSITGANPTTMIDTIPMLGAKDHVNLNFSNFSFSNTGNNIITVSLPPDDTLSNNSMTYFQIVNDSLFGYADSLYPVAGGAGFGTGEGIFYADYTLTGGDAYVPGVRVHIFNNVNNVGKTIYAIVNDTLSPGYVIQNADLGKYKTIYFTNPVRVNVDNPSRSQFGSIRVGIKQSASGTAYSPVSYQAMGPLNGASYYSQATGPDWIPQPYAGGRLMIEALVRTAPATWIYTDSLLAAWNFDGATSGITMPATVFHQNLTSSNLLTRGAGAPVSGGYNSFFSNGFGNNGISTANQDYFQFTIGTGSSDTLALSTILLNHMGGDTTYFLPAGATIQVAYSLNGTSFTLIGSASQVAIDGSITIDLRSVGALQNILSGTVVTFRLYASGNTPTGSFGFYTYYPYPLSSGIKVYGTIKRRVIIANAMVPTGAPYTIADCNSSVSGTISFTSLGTFPVGNVYTAKLNASQFYNGRDTVVVTIGTLVSNANSGTINITIPGTVFPGPHDIWIESSAFPGALSVPSKKFFISVSNQCAAAYSSFQSRQNGDWNNAATWDIMDPQTNTWSPSTIVPGRAAKSVTIRQQDSVTVTTPVFIHSVYIAGRLTVLNGTGNSGALIFQLNEANVPFPDLLYTMTIADGAALQVVSSGAPFREVIKTGPGYLNLFGKKYIKNFSRITIGDGSASNGDGYYYFATCADQRFRYFNNSVLEWNTTSSYSLVPDATYFKNENSVLRITKIASGSFGSSANTVVDGKLEVNTPVTMSGSGKKIFSDGILGAAKLTQDPGSGGLETTQAYAIVPPIGENTQTAILGIVDGTVTFDLGSPAGLTFINGATITDVSRIRVIGKVVSQGTVTVQPNGKMTIDPSSVLSIENSDLVNDGTIDGTGKIQFVGADTSRLRSPGIIDADVELLGKQLRLDGPATTRSISLLNGSHLRLDSFHLDMRNGLLTGDSSNFIVTNDTGRLSRYVAAADVTYNVGVSESSYSPVTINNTGLPDKFNVRVGPGVYDFASNPVTTGNVDRTWFISDSITGGSNIKLKIQWGRNAEQSGFDRSRSYISRLSICPLPRNCSGALYDLGEVNNAITSDQNNYTVERSSIDSFRTDRFIVTSNPFVYTFTGTGNWSDSANWTPGIPPPRVISAGMDVIINPGGSGECISNGNVLVVPPGRLTVLPGKKFRITTQ